MGAASPNSPLAQTADKQNWNHFLLSVAVHSGVTALWGHSEQDELVREKRVGCVDGAGVFKPSKLSSVQRAFHQTCCKCLVYGKINLALIFLFNQFANRCRQSHRSLFDQVV